MEEIEEAEAAAQDMLIALARKDASPIAPSDAARVRRQAYTLFYRAYEQVRRAVLYLRQPYGDMEAFAPPLRTVERKGSREDGDEGGVPVVTAAGANGNGNGNGNVSATTNTSSGIGLPTDHPTGRG